jgi:hypothetical protein
MWRISWRKLDSILLLSWLAIGFLVAINIPVVQASTEDFTTWNEVDGSGDITVAPSKVDSDLANWRNVGNNHVWKDYGEGYFGSAFTHNIEVYIDSTEDNTKGVRAVLLMYIEGNYHGSLVSMTSGSVLYAYLRWDDTLNEVGIGMQERLDTVGKDGDTMSGLSFDTLYYCTWDRNAGTVTFTIYSDSGRTVVVDTLTMSIETSTDSYRVMQVSTTCGYAHVRNSKFYVQNLEFLLAAVNYDFDLMVLFSNATGVNSANVTLTDNGESEVFHVTTNSSGQIATQTVSDSSPNPHTLRIFKEGIRTYISSFNITSDESLIVTVTTRDWTLGTEGISFQENIMPEVRTSYHNRTFYFSYKNWYLGLRPFAVYNGEVWNMADIIEFLKRQGVSYNWAFRKTKKMIHYGFNLTGIPPTISQNLDYLGFKVVDHTFPLSAIEKEEVQTPEYNYTVLHIPKVNWHFSFQDLQERGYTVTFINKTYMLIGNVRNKSFIDCDPITYSSPVITVIGFTEGVPCTFQDICDVNDLNGWGVVDALGSNQFYLEASLVIGDGTNATWFADSDVEVTFYTQTSTGAKDIEVKANANLRFGELVDSVNKVTDKGVSLIVQNDLDSRYGAAIYSDLGTAYLYSCTIRDAGVYQTSNLAKSLRTDNGRVWNCLIDNIQLSGESMDVYNTYFVNGYNALGYPADGTMERLVIRNTRFGIYWYSTLGGSVTDAIFTNCSTTAWADAVVDAYYLNEDCYLTNVEWDDTWDNVGEEGTSRLIYWHGTNYGKTIYERYTFDVNLLFENGTAVNNCNISLTDVNGTQIFNLQTGSNGSISEQIIIYRSYGYGDEYTENATQHGPHTLKVFKEGVRMYVSNLTLNRKMTLTLTLTPRGWTLGTEGISFQESCIPNVKTSYQNRTFYFSYDRWYLGLRPFAIYDGKTHTQNQIITFLQNQGVSYTWAFKKVKQMIHYGFNLTGIPPAISQNLDYLGFKVVDHSFPLSEIEKEIIETMEYNFTVLHIRKANLHFSFEDLLLRGYSVTFINKTYMLIGNVRSKSFIDCDPIAYSSPTISVVGGTSGNPLDFQDIVDVNDREGWGIADAVGTRQFYFEALIEIGNNTRAGETWFNDTSKQITFAKDLFSATGNSYINVRSYGHFTLGSVLNESLKSTTNGCSILVEENGYNGYPLFSHPSGFSYLYSCHIEQTGSRLVYCDVNQGRWWNDFVIGSYIFGDDDTDFFNVHVQDAPYGMIYPNAVTIDKFYVTDCISALYVRYSTTLTNLFARGCTNIFTFSAFQYGDFYLIDADSDTWDFNVVSGTDDLYRQYSFDLQLRFENQTAVSNCNVSLVDVDGTELFNLQTSAGGVIPTQNITYEIYHASNSSVTTKTPHTLKVFKMGIRPYKSVLTLDEKTDLKITLEPNSSPYARFTFSPSNPRPNQIVTFNGSYSSDSDGTINSYSWRFGDEDTASDMTTTHAYDEDGTYAIMLTVTDDHGATDSFNQTIRVLLGGSETRIPNVLHIHLEPVSPPTPGLIEVLILKDVRATAYVNITALAGEPMVLLQWTLSHSEEPILSGNRTVYLEAMHPQITATVPFSIPLQNGISSLSEGYLLDVQASVISEDGHKILEAEPLTTGFNLNSTLLNFQLAIITICSILAALCLLVLWRRGFILREGSPE